MGEWKAGIRVARFSTLARQTRRSNTMPGIRISLATAACALVAWGQSDSKTFYFPSAEPRVLQEYVNGIRSVGDIKDVTANPEKNSITVSGNDEQLSIATWIAQQMTNPPAARPSTVRRDYPGTVGKTDEIHVYFLAHVETPQDLQESINAIRSIADIQRFFPVNVAKAILARGTPAQAELASWLVGELDQPAGSLKPGRRDHPFPSDPRSNFVQLYVLANTAHPSAIQQIVNGTRSIADIQRCFPYNSRRVLLMRGSAQQILLADWVLDQLDRPAGTAVAANPGEFQYNDGPSGTSVARVFFPQTADTPQKLQAITNEVRTATEIQRAYPVDQPNAIVLRGTPDQISRAQELLKDR
jgi:hypothetical protein